MHLGLGPRRGLHEPPEQRLRLVVRAKLHQRVDDEVGVADPAEPVVPVALAADRFGQRRGRRRDVRSRRREDQSLQQQRAAGHLIAPRSGDGVRARPLLPENHRRLETRLDGRTRRKDEGLCIGAADHQQAAIPRSDFERRAKAVPAPCRRARLPALNRDGLAAEGGDRNRSAPPGADPAVAVIEPGRDLPAHRHRAGQPLDRADDLAHRLEAAIGNRHGVDDAYRAAVRGERRFQDVAVRQVAPGAVEPHRGLKLKRAAAARVEHGGEDTGRIEIRQAQPVDRSVACNKRGRPAVADQRVVLDRSIALDPHEMERCKKRPRCVFLRRLRTRRTRVTKQERTRVRKSQHSRQEARTDARQDVRNGQAFGV